MEKERKWGKYSASAQEKRTLRMTSISVKLALLKIL